MRPISTRLRVNAGYTLIEALVAFLVSSTLLAALASFYVSTQRALRHHQIEVETSQAIRVALEEMVRDLRSAGQNPLGVVTSPTVGLTQATASEVDFTLDTSGAAGVTTSTIVTKKFRRCIAGSVGTIETWVGGLSGGCDGTSGWQPLADYAQTTGTLFRYYKVVSGTVTEVTTLPASSADLAAINRVDISLSANRSLGGWQSVTRTESMSADLRNR